MTRINTNVSSLNAQKTLARSNAELQESLTRLSTGLRINSGKDDPAGLIASETLRADIVSTEVAITNSERANQMITTADSALGQVSSLLNDVRGLVSEAANEGAISVEQIAAKPVAGRLVARSHRPYCPSDPVPGQAALGRQPRLHHLGRRQQQHFQLADRPGQLRHPDGDCRLGRRRGPGRKGVAHLRFGERERERRAQGRRFQRLRGVQLRCRQHGYRNGRRDQPRLRLDRDLGRGRQRHRRRRHDRHRSPSAASATTTISS